MSQTNSEDIPEWLTTLWFTDAPPGQTYCCPDCGSKATLGGNAAFHVNEEGHGQPTLIPLTPEMPALERQNVKLATHLDGVLRLLLRISLAHQGLIPKEDMPLVQGAAALLLDWGEARVLVEEDPKKALIQARLDSMRLLGVLDEVVAGTDTLPPETLRRLREVVRILQEQHGKDS